MASSKIEVSSNAINPFQKFLTQIALQLVSRDVKVLKSLTVGKIPDRDMENIDTKEEYCALDWFYCLKKHGIIWENNVQFLIDVLNTARRPDLANKLEEHQVRIKENDRKERTKTKRILGEFVIRYKFIPDKTRAASLLNDLINS
jgi:hypothetical protein